MSEEQNISYEINYQNTPYNVYFTRDYQAFNIHSVKSWLKDHNTYNYELRKLSNFLYNANGAYTNVIDYMIALPTLDRVIHSRNSNHKRYKNNRKKFLDALDSMREKTIIRDILFKDALDGTSFFYFESKESKVTPKFMSDTEIDELGEINSRGDMNCSVLPLPTDYCRIVGYRNSSPQVAFDCSYFNQFMSNGLSKKLRRYPDEIRKAYRAYKSDLNKKWVVLDNDKTLAFKVRAKLEDRWGRPLGLAAFIDMLYDEYFLDSKRNVLDEVNSTIVYQTFPEGEKKGQSSLTQTQQKEQHNNIKQALFSKGIQKGINFFSVASGTKIDMLTTNLDLLKVNNGEEIIKRIATGLGFSSSILNGDGSSMSSEKSNLKLISAELFSWIEQIQNEFNKVINKNIIKDPQVYMEVSYLPITHANREEMVGYMKELYTHGSGSLKAWISSTGMNPEVYISLMDEEYEAGFDDKYPPHPISFTQTADDTKPKDNDPDNPNTIKNKNTGVNPT